MIEKIPGRILENIASLDADGRLWEMERVSCPICGCEDFREAHTWDSPYDKIKMRFSIAQCCGCKFKFTNPRLSSDALRQYYSQQSPYADHNYHEIEVVRPRYEQFLRQLGGHGLTKGAVLEVGCDKGQFLAIAREKGFVVDGIEPSASADLAQKLYDISVRRQTLEEADLPESRFDLVIMLDVLEHLHHPLSSLQKITRALVPGGLLLLKVPNVRHEYGLYPKLRGRTALGFGAHEHLNHFSRETLTEALRRSDLTVESWIGFIPLTGNGIVGRTARGLALAAGRCIAGTWANWSEYHLSLVCIARKTAGVTGKSPAQ